MGLEPSWDTKVDRRWAWLQIEVDLQNGLHDEIDLVWRNFTLTQQIDYWRIPFHCFGCHAVGHLQAQCSRTLANFSPFSKVWKRKKDLVSSISTLEVENINVECGSQKQPRLSCSSDNTTKSSPLSLTGKAFVYVSPVNSNNEVPSPKKFLCSSSPSSPRSKSSYKSPTLLC